MLNYPVTLEEAREYRYNQWSGNPRGQRYSEGRCAFEVWARRRLPHQCSFKSGHGPNDLYCKIHAKNF